MTKTVPAGTAPATCAVNATATNGSYPGTGNANCTVTAPPPPPSATVSVPNSTYAPRSTVPMTATVLSGANPASGASVKFTLTKPNGSTATKKVTTGTNGTAAWSYRLGAKDPNGAYSVCAQVAYGSQTTTSNTVNFTVQ